VGDTATAAALRNRSDRAWRSLWDPAFKGGFLRAKDEHGGWESPFDEFAWDGPYTEGSAWQYRFYVPHDPEGLAAAYDKAAKDDKAASTAVRLGAAGGSGDRPSATPMLRPMCEYLVQAMAGRATDPTDPTDPTDTADAGEGPGATFHVRPGQWPLQHEQTEMVANCFGQYEHNDQPVWHMIWMMLGAGCPSEAQYWLRQATSRFYGPDYFSGDEDNGSMASWYLLSAMGLYQLVPGNTSYSIGSPMYRDLSLTMDNGATLHIRAPANSPSSPYVHGVRFNGASLKVLAIEYEELRKGGELEFDMAGVACRDWPCS
jgi:putative alpha-1,2-mannosidase